MIEQIDEINGSEVHFLALEIEGELTKQFGRGIFHPHPADSALTVREEGAIVALLVWRILAEDDCVWIGIAWTDPRRRRQGFYRSLVEELCAIVKARGLGKIGCGVARANITSMQVHHALPGFREVDDRVALFERSLHACV